MTIGEWIDRRVRQVPPEFRPHLTAAGPVSLDALLAAAEREVEVGMAQAPRDRTAAFALLAADAYVTYACEVAIAEGGDGASLGDVVRRVAHGWRERLR